MIPRLVPALATLALVAALAPACSSAAIPPFKVALYSQLGNSTDHPATQCQLTYTEWLNVGAVGAGQTPGALTVPVTDGDTDQGRAISVPICSVVAAGDGYDVNVSVKVGGSAGGSFSVNGHFTGAGTQTNIQAVFQRGDTGAFKENDCQATLGTAARPEMGIAPGRVWAMIECPNVILSNSARVCRAAAEFRFENCSQ
jgi:hypothetical protein